MAARPNGMTRGTARWPRSQTGVSPQGQGPEHAINSYQGSNSYNDYRCYDDHDSARAPDRIDQIRRGEYQHGYGHDHQSRVNIYKTVDSWRSYSGGNNSLQATMFPPFRQDYQQHSHQPTPEAPFTPSHSFTAVYSGNNYHQPRHVLRQSAVTHGRAISHQQSTCLTNTSRYDFRNLLPSQIASFGTLAADVPVPSIEQQTGHQFGAPQNLPSRFGDRRSHSRPLAPPPPEPTQKYLQNATKKPATVAVPKKLLVILDLNGTLLLRPNRKADPTRFTLRPGVTDLLDYLFEHHVVMVYSSARPENVQAIVNKLFGPHQRALLAGIWARDKLDLTPNQYNAKVQVYKKLDKIWQDSSIGAHAPLGCRWNHSNTVLVDDSHLKALAQPHNLIQVTEFDRTAPRENEEALRNWQAEHENVLKSLEQKLEQLKWQVDVCRLIRQWQNGSLRAPGIVDETVDQKTHQAVRTQPTSIVPALSPYSGSPTPSVGQVDTIAEEQLSHFSYPSPPTFPQDENRIGDKGHSASNSATINEAEISAVLQKTSIGDTVVRRSESPIGEKIFQELLAGGQDIKKKTKNKKRARRSKKLVGNDAPPTPESMGG